MTTPDPWSGLPLTGEEAEALSGGILTRDAPDSAASVRRILDWVHRYCGWHVVGQRTETLTVDGPGETTVHLPTLRLVDVVEVVEDEWDGQAVNGVARSEPVDFTWSVHGILEKRSGVWTRERRGVHVTCIHGFDVADALLGVVVAAAVRHASTPDGNMLSRVGDISYQSNGAATAGGSAFLLSEYAVLDQYRLNPGV